jgi:hypothetical protein
MNSYNFQGFNLQDLLVLQYNIGCSYYSGKRVEKNSRIAFDVFHDLAQKNHTNAQVMLGMCYFYGRGVEKDYALALEWWARAANQGDETAQTVLAHAIKDNTQKFSEALFSKAAKQGDKSAKKTLHLLKYKPLYFLTVFVVVLGAIMYNYFMHNPIEWPFNSKIANDETENFVPLKVSKLTPEVITEINEIWNNYDSSTFGETYWAEDENYENFPPLTEAQIIVSNHLKQIYKNILMQSAEFEFMPIDEENLNKRLNNVEVVFVDNMFIPNYTKFWFGGHVNCNNGREIIFLGSKSFYMTNETLRIIALGTDKINDITLNYYLRYGFADFLSVEQTSEIKQILFNDFLLESFTHELSHVFFRDEGIVELLNYIINNEYSESTNIFDYYGRREIYRGLRSASPMNFWGIAFNKDTDIQQYKAFKDMFNYGYIKSLTYDDFCMLWHTTMLLFISDSIATDFIDINDISVDMNVETNKQAIDFMNEYYQKIMQTSEYNSNELEIFRAYISSIDELYKVEFGVSIMQQEVIFSDNKNQLVFLLTLHSLSIFLGFFVGLTSYRNKGGRYFWTYSIISIVLSVFIYIILL